MARRAISKKRVLQMRARFRELVDWAFDGDLALAAQALRMPKSTIHKYHSEGPRRIPRATLDSIERVTGLARWLTGELRDESTGGKFPQSIAQALGALGGWNSFGTPEARLMIPACTNWRIDRVVEAMQQTTEGLDRQTALATIFAADLAGLEHGILRSPGAHLPATGGGRIHFNLDDPAAMGGHGKDAAKIVHLACEPWERRLSIARGRRERRPQGSPGAPFAGGRGV